MKSDDIIFLELAMESDSVNEFVKNDISILLSAINDWSEPVSNLIEFEIAISGYLNNQVTSSSINDKLSKIDYSKAAWFGESLWQVKELFDRHDNCKTLKELILELTKPLNS